MGKTMRTMMVMSRFQISLFVAALILLAGVLALAAMGRLESKLAAAESENGRLVSELLTAQVRADSLARQAELDRAALLEREKTVQELSEAKGRLDAQLREIYATDCEAAAWADAPVPDSVYQRLLQALPRAPADAAAGRSSPNRADAPAPGPNQ